MPLVGLQIILSVILCFIFRVNVTSAVVATFISNPLTGPGILYIQYLVGKEFSTPIDPAQLEQLTGVFKLWAANGKPLIIGVLITSIMGAILAYPITLLLWSVVTKATAKALAIRNAKHNI